MGPRAGPDGYRNSGPYWDMIPTIHPLASCYTDYAIPAHLVASMV